MLVKFGFASSEFFFSSFVLNGHQRGAVVPAGAALGLAPTRWEIFPQHPDEKNNGDVLPKGICAYDELQAPYDTFEYWARPCYLSVLDKARLLSGVRVDNAVLARKFVGVPCFLSEGGGSKGGAQSGVNNAEEFARCVRDAGAHALTAATEEKRKAAEQAEDAPRAALEGGAVAVTT